MTRDLRQHGVVPPHQDNCLHTEKLGQHQRTPHTGTCRHPAGDCAGGLLHNLYMILAQCLIYFATQVYTVPSEHKVVINNYQVRGSYCVDIYVDYREKFYLYCKLSICFHIPILEKTLLTLC